MKNPLTMPRDPNDKIQDVADLARDLTYGALQGDWAATMRDSVFVGMPFNQSIIAKGQSTENQSLYWEKWGEWGFEAKTFALLASFGYLDAEALEGYSDLVKNAGGKYAYTQYQLTTKAFDLLKKPDVAATVFISYRRIESSALAVALEARLRITDPKITVRIDKDIDAGSWKQKLEKWIDECKFAVCLIGPSTLDSLIVKEEIQYALKLGKIIIPACHSGILLLPSCEKIREFAAEIKITPPDYQEPQGFQIGKMMAHESAMDYEDLINRVIAAMGYRTY